MVLNREPNHRQSTNRSLTASLANSAVMARRLAAALRATLVELGNIDHPRITCGITCKLVCPWGNCFLSRAERACGINRFPPIGRTTYQEGQSRAASGA